MLYVKTKVMQLCRFKVPFISFIHRLLKIRSSLFGPSDKYTDVKPWLT